MAEEGASKMPGGWWIPVLAAVVGLVGGVGGAYVGGEVSNNGQEQQFENQRAAELQDLLIGAYASYLRANSRWALDPESKQLRAEALAAETEVEFEAADSDVDVAAQGLFDVVEQRGNYDAARDHFIEAAGRSLEE
jgi:ATP/maltotriose-dependent transcriptional regulator MalT